MWVGGIQFNRSTAGVPPADRFQGLFQCEFPIPADTHFSAVAQNSHTVTKASSSELTDPIQIDDSRTVNTKKFLGVQPFFQAAHAFAHQMGSGNSVQDNVIIGGFDPIYFVCFQIEHMSNRPDFQTRWIDTSFTPTCHIRKKCKLRSSIEKKGRSH